MFGEDKILTVGEAAAYLRTHPLTIHRLLRKGAFPGALRIGRVWRIPQSVLEELGRLALGKPNRPPAAWMKAASL